MPTIAQVRQQIAAYPHSYIFWTQKEIRALPEVLDHGETIKALTSGMLNGSTWLAVCTERRLIFLNRGFFWGTEQIQMPLDRVQSIDHQFTFFFGNIRVFDGVNVFQLNMVLKSSILPFVKVAEEQMYALRHVAAAPASHAAAAPADVASQLAKLAELKEKGYLTDAEFQAQKKKLLG
ncbi:MAG: PH domain-containing protein [Pseudomonadota bacterium]|nr:PH domain-containing protein [Pseudomonadota bacterium]